MRWIVSRPRLTAGCLLAAALGGCQLGDSPRQAWRPAQPAPAAAKAAAAALPGGVVPTSYRVVAPTPASPIPLAAAEVAPPARPEPPAVIQASSRPAAAVTDYSQRAAPLPVLPPPPCGCAPGHRWLVGRLEHDPGRDRWWVRYAHPGAGDVYGGVLELFRTGPMEGFRPGQQVRVEGELIDPAPYEIKPGYRVHSLQALSR